MRKNRYSLAVGLFAAGVVTASGFSVSAQAITLANPDFESDAFLDPGTSLFLLSTQDATFEVAQWQQVGPPPNFESGIASTGTFRNVESSVGSTTFPVIGNSSVNPGLSTDRLAFLSVDPTAPDGVAIFQETQAFFELGKDYTLSLSAGPSTTFPPSSNNPLVDPASLVISIGYLDGSGDFVSVQDQVITQFIDDDIDSPDEIKDRFEVLDNDPGFNLLKSFSVTAIDPALSDASLLTEKIAIQISTDGVAGSAGFFSVDTVRLTQVPEPASLVLLATGGLLALRRQRSPRCQ